MNAATRSRDSYARYGEIKPDSRGFSAKDVIDVTELAATSAVLSGGVLTLSDGVRGGAISLSGQISGDVHVTPDRSGGTRITIG